MSDWQLPSPRLPPELTDQIIGHLDTDALALSACALTCKAWLPATRFYRFNRAYLDYQRLPTVYKFLALLNDSPGVCPFFTRIDVRSETWRGIDGRTLGDDIAMLLKRLRNVEKLRLSVKHHPLPHHIQELSQSMFRIKHFELSLSYMTLHYLSALTRYCRSLEYLKLWVILGLPPQPKWREIFPSPSIKHLQIKNASFDDMDALCDWLMSDKPAFWLGCLEVGIAEAAEAKVVSTMLHRLGGGISSVILEIDSYAGIHQLFREVELGIDKCRILEDCCLVFHLHEMFVAESQLLQWIYDCLSKLASPHLHTIEIIIFADPMTDLRALDSECGMRNLELVKFDTMIHEWDWHRLERIFTRERLDSLRSVALVGQGDSSRLEAFLAKSYPRLATLLHFKFQTRNYIKPGDMSSLLSLHL